MISLVEYLDRKVEVSIVGDLTFPTPTPLVTLFLLIKCLLKKIVKIDMVHIRKQRKGRSI